MFTGFATENTPAIQVWNFFATSSGSNSSVSLSDDCAPIQMFRTGGGSSAIPVFLPTSPIEGKVITITNQNYGIFPGTSLLIKSSDISGSGTESTLITLGIGGTVNLVYSKNAIGFGFSSGNLRSGWITLNSMSQTAVNYGSAVLGGNSNVASNAYSVVLGGNSNTANALNASVTGGTSNNATGTHSALVGGSSNTANAQAAFIAGGNSNGASAFSASVVGGYGNSADSRASGIFAGAYGTSRSIAGNTVLPANDSPISSTAGVTQSALLVLARQTTNATATVLRSDSSAASTTNQVILPNNSAYVFQGTCIANVTGGSTTSGWKFEGVIKRGANAASTTLVAAVTPIVIAQDALATTWVLAITADTTNGGIAVTVTGAAATTIRWVSRIETTEVTF